MRQLARKGRTVIAVDLRGIGETALPSDLNESPYSHFSMRRPRQCTRRGTWTGAFGHARSGPDPERGLRLSRPGVDQSGVEMIGKGACAVWSLYAAAFDSRVQALVAERGLIPYASLTTVDRTCTAPKFSSGTC